MFKMISEFVGSKEFFGMIVAMVVINAVTAILLVMAN